MKKKLKLFNLIKLSKYIFRFLNISERRSEEIFGSKVWIKRKKQLLRLNFRFCCLVDLKLQKLMERKGNKYFAEG